MDIQDIYGIVDKFEQSSMTEFQIKIDNMELVCKRNDVDSAYDYNKSTLPKNQNETNLVFSEKSEKKQQNDNNIIETKGKLYELKSKVAGTFYRAASPDLEPFIQVGQQVKKGDVVGMIEAMKMMNDIICPIDGIVTEIIAKNEELVGFDSVLIKIAE